MPWDDGLDQTSAAYDIASNGAARLRVIAGPGTGKSFAMKRRVARLLESGVEPSKILPVTFTRVAAEDLHRELANMAVARADELEATTLHSLALRRLVRHHVLEATGRVPRPLNEFELAPMIADLAAAFNGVKPVKKMILAFEAAWAREQADPTGQPAEVEIAFEAALNEWLRFHDAMLIGEVVPVFLSYLQNNVTAPERTEFSHILVDEYQDLNRAEQELIDLMAGSAEVCIVGDDDQSIYSFRHAHPDGILEWQVDQGGPTDVALHECRRSPCRVVRMANSLISRNVHRDQARQLTEMAQNGEGTVRIFQYNSVAQEVAGIVSIIKNLVEAGTAPGDILVLAQRDVIGSPIFEGLVENGIPARSYYAEAELESEFAQERYAYLKLLASSDDKVSLRWLVGLGGNNWHRAGYSRVRAHCEQSGLSPWAVLTSLADGELQLPYTHGIVARFEEVRARIDFLNGLLEQNGLNAIIDDLFDDDEPRVRELRSLLLSALEALGDTPDILELLQTVNEAIAKPEIPELVEDVRIMSLHKSKGLSAPVTIIAGCIEGLLPRQPSADDPPAKQLASIEEQRRLFYVGVTRVKADVNAGKPGILVLSSAAEMPMAEALGSGIRPAQIVYGAARLLPSRFLSEFGGHAPAPTAG